MIRNGIDNIDQHTDKFRGKRIGLITSPTGLTAEMLSTIQIMHERFELVALFSPEHGVRGDLEAGVIVDSYVDSITGIPVHSLYRQDSKRLSDEMLNDVDMVVYDIQDVGVRYYTYIYTMLNTLEDCARAGKEVAVLDRINPLNGVTVEGNVLKPDYRSFIGNYPLCNRYGLTAGEVALMANEQMNWHAKLHVIRCGGWEREMMFSDTGRIWVMPSMGIPRFETALLYPGTCLFEGTNLSEGRGTTAPFELIGAPYIQAEKLANEMNRQQLPGVRFRPAYFKPTFSKHEGVLCHGVQLHVTDVHKLQPLATGITLLHMIQHNYEEFAYLPPLREGSRPFIDLLCGDKLLHAGEWDIQSLLASFEEESRRFSVMKKGYHLY